VIGDRKIWDTQRVEVTRTPDLVKIEIFTNKHKNDEGGVPFADLAFDLSPDDAIDGPFNIWHLGIDFQYNAGDPADVVTKVSGKEVSRVGQRRLYGLNANTLWQTSYETYGQFQGTGTIYGGRFRAADCGAPNAGDGDPAACNDATPVAEDEKGFEPPVNIPLGVAGVTHLGNVSFRIDQIEVPGLTSPYLDDNNVDTPSTKITLELSGLAFGKSGLGLDPFDLYWGTGQCSNDGIWGNVPGISEPATLALFGLGLTILGFFVAVRADTIRPRRGGRGAVPPAGPRVRATVRNSRASRHGARRRSRARLPHTPRVGASARWRFRRRNGCHRRGIARR